MLIPKVIKSNTSTCKDYINNDLSISFTKENNNKLKELLDHKKNCVVNLKKDNFSSVEDLISFNKNSSQNIVEHSTAISFTKENSKKCFFNKNNSIINNFKTCSKSCNFKNLKVEIKTVFNNLLVNKLTNNNNSKYLISEDISSINSDISKENIKVDSNFLTNKNYDVNYCNINCNIKNEFRMDIKVKKSDQFYLINNKSNKNLLLNNSEDNINNNYVSNTNINELYSSLNSFTDDLYLKNNSDLSNIYKKYDNCPDKIKENEDITTFRNNYINEYIFGEPYNISNDLAQQFDTKVSNEILNTEDSKKFNQIDAVKRNNNCNLIQTINNNIDNNYILTSNINQEKDKLSKILDISNICKKHKKDNINYISNYNSKYNYLKKSNEGINFNKLYKLNKITLSNYKVYIYPIFDSLICSKKGSFFLLRKITQFENSSKDILFQDVSISVNIILLLFINRFKIAL